MKDRIVTKEERQRIQLQMLREIDTFCRQKGIRYSLSNGTLLGAIRHGGYIPWDDDVDIVMTLPDMLRFKKEFRSKDLKYCDIDTEPHFEFPFSRIAYQPTYAKKGMTFKTCGINIDLYPVLGLPQTKEGITQFFEDASNRRESLLHLRKWNYRLRNRLPINALPFYDRQIRKYRDFLYSYPYEGTNYFFHYGGFIRWSKVFDCDLFAEMTDIIFEGEKFMAFSDWDGYLHHVYGDYMQLPPEDQRQPYHNEKYYWKR
jgi:lipopolysaccharide cholinephosphotransferase